MPTRTQPSLSSKTPFIQRLGYYMLGLAIGLMMVGLIISMRSRAMSQQGQTNGAAATTNPAAAPASPASPR